MSFVGLLVYLAYSHAQITPAILDLPKTTSFIETQDQIIAEIVPSLPEAQIAVHLDPAKKILTVGIRPAASQEATPYTLHRTPVGIDLTAAFKVYRASQNGADRLVFSDHKPDGSYVEVPVRPLSTQDLALAGSFPVKPQIHDLKSLRKPASQQTLPNRGSSWNQMTVPGSSADTFEPSPFTR